MDSLMATHALLLHFRQATIIEGRQSLLCSYKQPINMVFLHACEVTMAWRIFWLRHGWNHSEGFAVDPISGEGKFNLIIIY